MQRRPPPASLARPPACCCPLRFTGALPALKRGLARRPELVPSEPSYAQLRIRCLSDERRNSKVVGPLLRGKLQPARKTQYSAVVVEVHSRRVPSKASVAAPGRLFDWRVADQCCSFDTAAIDGHRTGETRFFTTRTSFADYRINDRADEERALGIVPRASYSPSKFRSERGKRFHAFLVN